MTTIRFILYRAHCAACLPIYWAFMALHSRLYRCDEGTRRYRFYLWMLPHAGMWGYRMSYDEWTGMNERIPEEKENA